MKCEDIQRRIYELRGKALRTPSAEVERHIDTCPACRLHYRQWSAIVGSLETSAAHVAPPGLGEAIIARVRDREAKGVRALPGIRPALRALPAGVGIAVVVLLVLIGLLPDRGPVGPSEGTGNSTRVSHEVHFVLRAPEARSVAVAGDFNGWHTGKDSLQLTEDGQWEITMSLDAGAYQYQFVINGSLWQPDPDNPVLVADGFGGYNSCIEL